MMNPRDYRQSRAMDWIREIFGDAVANDKFERARRFFEEAAELAQACGLNKTECRALIEHVFSKPIGDPKQEAGGVGITLLALCELLGISAERAEADELGRVLNLPAPHFRKRQNIKADAGVALQCDHVKQGAA